MKRRRIARIPHRRSGNHANLIHAVRLHRALKSLERAQRSRHRLRRHQPRSEDARAQPRHFAILVQRAKLMRNDLGDLQPAGVGTDINGRKRGHERRNEPHKIEISIFGQDTRLHRNAVSLLITLAVCSDRAAPSTSSAFVRNSALRASPT